jgi:hypothetical protein
MKFHQEKEGCSPPNFQENLQSLHLCVCVCVFVSSFPLCIVKFVDEKLVAQPNYWKSMFVLQAF